MTIRVTWARFSLGSDLWQGRAHFCGCWQVGATGRDEWPYSSVLVLRSRGIGQKGSKSNGLKLLGFRVKATAHGSCWVAPMLEGALGGISWWAEG